MVVESAPMEAPAPIEAAAVVPPVNIPAVAEASTEEVPVAEKSEEPPSNSADGGDPEAQKDVPQQSIEVSCRSRKEVRSGTDMY